MRKIRISVDKPVLDSLTVHHATSYQIASTPYFRPEDILVENLNDEIHKDYESPFETKLDIPKANISKIILPWKALKTKWRRTNIVDGFRLQFMNSF